MKRIWFMVAILLLLLVILWMRADGQRRAALTIKAEHEQAAVLPVQPSVQAAQVGVSADAAVRPIGFGLTFALALQDEKLPSDLVGLSCHGEPRQLDRPHQDSCNPYQGDTSCRTVLPVLCVKVTGAPKPGGVQDSFYQGWVSGTLAATRPVMGAVLESPAIASARCVKELGEGWKMAEFHDGQGGWGLQGQKGMGFESNTRYWVHVNDQPGNCWNSEP